MKPGELRQYLLGRASTAERERIEARLFDDDDFDEQLQEAEADLLDDWARGLLAEEDARAVRQRFAAEKLAVARELARLAQRTDRRKRPLAWMLAAAAVVIAGMLWIANRPAAEPVPREIATVPERTEQLQLVALDLGSTRAANVPVVRVRPETTVLRFAVPAIPGAGDGGFAMQLEMASGGASLPRKPANAQDGKLTMDVPAETVPAGDYELLVYAIADGKLAASFAFRLERQPVH